MLNANMKLNPKKCFFFSDTAEFVGHEITAEGYRPLQNYVDAVNSAPTPTSVKELRQFLGLASYLRRFVKNFSGIVQPLTRLLKKDTRWEWGPAQDTAVAEVRDRLTRAPVLRFVDPSRPLRLATDWSVDGVGAVLSQIDDEGREYICGYLSKTCTPAERRYSAFKGELLAVLWACEKWRHYLGGRQFDLITDHKALEWLMTAKELPASLARWVLRLDELLNINIIHRPGTENAGPDYLSRNPVPGSSRPPPPGRDMACGAALAAHIAVVGGLPAAFSVGNLAADLLCAAAEVLLRPDPQPEGGGELRDADWGGVERATSLGRIALVAAALAAGADEGIGTKGAPTDPTADGALLRYLRDGAPTALADLTQPPRAGARDPAGAALPLGHQRPRGRAAPPAVRLRRHSPCAANRRAARAHRHRARRWANAPGGAADLCGPHQHVLVAEHVRRRGSRGAAGVHRV